MTKFDDVAAFWQAVSAPYTPPGSELGETMKKSTDAWEKAVNIALTAASDTASINEKWTKAAFDNLRELSAARENSTDNFSAWQDFASKAAEASSENLLAYSEVVRKSQLATAELAQSYTV